MLVQSYEPLPVECRLATVPACEPDCDVGHNATIEALATFQLRLRDTIDFRVDFSKWLTANGNASLTEATFVAAEDSPSAPVIVGQSYIASGLCAVVLSAHEDAEAGQAYWIDVTAHVAATQPTSPLEVAIPARTLVRRINVVLVTG